MFDDNRPCLDALDWLTEDDRRKIFEANVRKAYPRLNAALDTARGSVPVTLTPFAGARHKFRVP